MVQPSAQGVSGKDFYYPPIPWDVNATIESCKAQFNVTARPDWANGTTLILITTIYPRMVMTPINLMNLTLLPY